MKTCNRCGEIKELELFTKAKMCKDGHRNYCKKCRSKDMHKWYIDNQTQCYQKNREWVKNNIDKDKQYKATYRFKTSSKVKDKQYREVNKIKLAYNTLMWNINNRGKSNAIKIQYKTKKKQRTPKWVDAEELWLIAEVYDLAERRNKVTNIKWHVDHIVPLQGRLVSGLHVISNLQVIPAKLNWSKGNKYAET